MHYHSFEDAREKWLMRMKRIDFDNLYVVFVQQDECVDDQVRQFDGMDFPHKVALVNRRIDGVECQYVIKGYEHLSTLGHITDFKNIFGTRHYDAYDWRKFLNI